MIISNKKSKTKTSLWLAFLVASVFFTFPQKTEAKIYPDWAAEKYSKIGEVVLQPGEVKKIKIGFYNRGAYNWRNIGKNYVSLYTFKPKYHPSPLADATWLSNSHPAKLKDSLAGPNSLGYFEFYLKAPKKEGLYRETFALAAENRTWIPGGQFELAVTVTSAPPLEEAIDKETENAAEEARELKAARLSRIDNLILDPQQETTLSILFLNQGKTSWQTRKILLDGLVVWENANGEVKTSATEIANLSLKAPTEIGDYNWHFVLTANENPVEGGAVDVPLTVGAASNPMASSTTAVVSLEPDIRIGLFTTEEPLNVKISSRYELQDTAGQIFSQLNEEDETTFSFKEGNKTYHAVVNGQTFASPLPLRLVAKDQAGYFTIANYTRNPRWTDHVNYNQFRGNLELRHAKTGYTWAINELPLEFYLKGMAEANDTAPPEFLKALMTAARSYAYYNILHPSKHILGNFILDSDNDQVYRGLVKEKASPNTVAAVKATQGLIAAYNGEAVETPYFARSNGRTKNWKEVFGGSDKPWLVSVKTKYDQGKTRWGHGVGLSANDALQRAKKEGLNWQELLKYYYKGIEVQRIY